MSVLDCVGQISVLLKRVHSEDFAEVASEVRNLLHLMEKGLRAFVLW